MFLEIFASTIRHKVDGIPDVLEVIRFQAFDVSQLLRIPSFVISRFSTTTSLSSHSP
jgi:hypothetical protein